MGNNDIQLVGFDKVAGTETYKTNDGRLVTVNREAKTDLKNYDQLVNMQWISQVPPPLATPAISPTETVDKAETTYRLPNDAVAKQATLEKRTREQAQANNALALGNLNQSRSTNPGNYSLNPAEGNILVPNAPKGANILEASSISGVNKSIGKKYSRKDRLDYGFTFEYVHGNDRRHITLFVNPEEFNQQEPGRINVTQTRGGAFVDYFGPGLYTITMRGVTGYHERQVGKSKVSGHIHFLQVREMWREWMKVTQIDPKITEMRFYNWADQEYYKVAITNFQLMRNVQRPLLYQYSIQMTVIQNITEKVKKAAKDNDATNYLINPEKRAILAKDSLDKNLKTIDDVVDKRNTGATTSEEKSVSGFLRVDQNSRDWGSKISAGENYFNKAQGVYKPIEGVISEVNQFSKDLKMYVSGATSFITKPFDLVKDMSNALKDVVSTMVSVTNIPHDLVRSFREMICALKALPESLFKGFTNPDLFEGASNCGTTLGIAEAPVSAYSNSFTATAQVQSQRQMNQIVNVPAKEIILQEAPSLVSGVYAATDTARTGLNYLSTITGNQVTLTSVPNVPIVVDYIVPQPGTVDMIRLRASGVHRVATDDTLERIALKFYNDPSEWKKIALFNYLEYPFLVGEDFERERYAIGVVRFYRDPTYTPAVVIPNGQTVYVPNTLGVGTIQINFRTTEEVVLDISQTFVDAPVVCERTGEIGNVAPRLITGLDGYSGKIKSIVNVYSTAGGKTWKVKKTGEVLFIPQSNTSETSVIIGAGPKYEELFGVDVLINKDGEWEASTEESLDLKTVSGTKNLVQALNNRISTRRGFYPYHDEYGSNLPLYIGQKNDPKRQDLVRVDIKETALLDPRISELSAFNMILTGDLIFIEFDAIPIDDNTPLKVNLIV